MAQKKGGGSTRNGRDSNAQRLGIKRYGGEYVLRTGDAHEKYNFMPYDTQDGELCLGFFETKSTNGAFSNQLHIERIEGVSSVSTMGGQQIQINVDINPVLLASYNLSPTDVLQTIQMGS